MARIILLLSLALLLMPGFGAPVRAQDFSPEQEQEWKDAQAALEAARGAQAEKYSAENLRKAAEMLETAQKARPSKDEIGFVQASRLARAYADLARAVAEHQAEEAKLAAVRQELQKAKAELEQLKKTTQ